MITIVHKKPRIRNDSLVKHSEVVTNSIENENNCKKFSHWLEVSIPGDRFCYHTGTHITGSIVGRIAYRAYESGRVSLFQKRMGNQFEYWAQKKRRWEG